MGTMGNEGETDPPFRSMVRASGLGEIWTHTHDAYKFDQFGWRCKNKETGYSSKTLNGNWNEQRFDIRHEKMAKRLPSQYEHYFDTTYQIDYDTFPHKVPETLKHLKERQPHAFPHH